MQGFQIFSKAWGPGKLTGCENNICHAGLV